jgi:uncharacterized membrane protein YczE
MELKWLLAVAFEAGFWLMLAAFLVLRYRYGMENITRLFVIGVVIDTAGIVGLGVWDFVNTGHFSVYTAFIVGLILYSLTSGRKHLVHLDEWMSRKIKPKRGRRQPRARAMPEHC